MTAARPVVFTIAGYDPSSGAGVTADIKTIAAHGCFGVSCITALTVQSTAGVRRVEPLSGDLVAQTLAELAADTPIAGVRIGMLGGAGPAEAVADFLEAHRPANVVLDPILKSSSGADLLDRAGVEILRRRLLRLADVITPNVDEASVLTGITVSNLGEMRTASLRLHEMGARAVVITGGHVTPPVDLLSAGSIEQEFASDHVESTSTHGTGCAFATALTCHLAKGVLLSDAVRAAKQYVAEAIRHAYPVGRGHGPLNHLYRFEGQ